MKNTFTPDYAIEAVYKPHTDFKPARYTLTMGACKATYSDPNSATSMGEAVAILVEKFTNEFPSAKEFKHYAAYRTIKGFVVVPKKPEPVFESEQSIREAIDAGKIVTMANPWMRVLIREDGSLYVANVRAGVEYDWLDVDVLYCQVITPEQFKEAERGNW